MWFDELKKTKRHPMGRFTLGLGDMVHTHDEVRIDAKDLDRLIEIVEGAEQAEDGEGNLFCPICGVFWSHDRSKLKTKYGDDIHLSSCPYSDSYGEE
jgi:hypothetical protein